MVQFTPGGEEMSLLTSTKTQLFQGWEFSTNHFWRSPTFSEASRRLGLGRGAKGDIEIVGVVRSSKYATVHEKIPSEVYLAFAQDENPGSLVVYARTAGDPKAVFAALRREVGGLDHQRARDAGAA